MIRKKYEQLIMQTITFELSDVIMSSGGGTDPLIADYDWDNVRFYNS